MDTAEPDLERPLPGPWLPAYSRPSTMTRRLAISPLLQSVLYHLLVKEGCEHRFAWGMFAAVTPVRFLETESRKTVMTVVTWLLSHSLAWLVEMNRCLHETEIGKFLGL